MKDHPLTGWSFIFVKQSFVPPICLHWATIISAVDLEYPIYLLFSCCSHSGSGNVL